MTRRLVAAGVAVNLLGAAVIFVYLSYVFPLGSGDASPTPLVSLAILSVYALASLLYGISRLMRETREARTWMRSERPATPEIRDQVLRLPARATRSTAQAWLVGALLFAALNVGNGTQYALEVLASALLGGITTSAGLYLVTERAIRPQLPLVLEAGAPDAKAPAPGIALRIVLTWLLCAGVPLVGLALVPTGRVPDDAHDLARPIWFVVAVALVVGAVLMTLTAKAVAEPLRGVREALDAVADGRFDVEVSIDDASEIGRLQAGVNAMVEGLRERERMRDLYGRQVGADVARQALERGAQLGGEARTVSALFVDVVGSTELATRESPERVVELLNAFFSDVVGTVTRHGGLVNKFEGDAALCVFGAPVPQPDHAARALAAARELCTTLSSREGGLQAAIGVSCGEVVAGNVGAEERFEYTVIGDPVNEAARLTELARDRAGRLLASARIVEAAGGSEALRWRVDGEVLLRGRAEPTPLAEPA
jgi:adenylate cyclase